MILWVFQLKGTRYNAILKHAAFRLTKKGKQDRKAQLIDFIFIYYVSFLCSAVQIMKQNTEKWLKTLLTYISENNFQDLSLKNNGSHNILLEVRLMIFMMAVHQIVTSPSLIQLFIKCVKSKIHSLVKACFAAILTERNLR